MGACMRRYAAKELAELPTLSTSQADSLKVEGQDERGYYRVWLCRCGVADGMPYDNQVTVERLTAEGRWRTVEKYPGGDR
jgi:CDGSH-type Zn-finger protein